MRHADPSRLFWRQVVAVTVLAALLPPLHAQPFSCPAVQPSRSQTPAYARAGPQPLCEGFFEQTVSQPFLELVSATRGVARLRLAQPLAWTGGARRLRLLVQPLQAAPFYRVDAELAPDAPEPLRWDPSRMLQATGLHPEALGFLALADPTGGLPHVAALALPAEPSELQPQVVYLTLRPSVALATLAWRAYAPSPAEAPAWQVAPGRPPMAWQPATLAIPRPAEAAGWRVDVRAQDRQGQALPLLSFLLTDAAP